MKAKLKHIITNILNWQAKKVIARYQPTIVVVGGDVGKTTTKDAVFESIKSLGSVRKSQGSFNSELGLPLTILDRPTGWSSPGVWIRTITKGFQLMFGKETFPSVLVLELGDRKPGDTALLTKWLPIDILIITKIDPIPTHLEFFSSVEEHRREKQILMESVSAGGHIIINNDDGLSRELLESGDIKKNVTVRTFGKQQSLPRPDIGIKQILIDNKQGMLQTSAMLIIGDRTETLMTSGHLGEGIVLAACAGLLVGAIFEVPLETILDTFANNPDLPRGRLRVIAGIRKTTILDDTYNAGPASTKLALDTLNGVPKIKRRIALLADMLELGSASEEQHDLIGEYAKDKVDVLVTVGKQAKKIGLSAGNAGLSSKSIFHFTNSREAGKFVEQMSQTGDLILIKGSQGMRMERAVQAIMLHPEKREEMLVRQERYWIHKA